MKTPDPRFCSEERGGGFKFRTSCYHVVSELKTWDEAKEHCRKNFNGHLVTILDLPIDVAVQYLISDEKEVWIGIKIQVSLNELFAIFKGIFLRNTQIKSKFIICLEL